MQTRASFEPGNQRDRAKPNGGRHPAGTTLTIAIAIAIAIAVAVAVAVATTTAAAITLTITLLAPLRA